MTTITYKGEPKTVEGQRPKLSEKAPAFSMENMEGIIFDNDKIKGKKTLISVFPDINTSVCDLQTKHAYSLFKDRDDMIILNVSNNTKEQLKDWCLLQAIDMEMLVDADRKFADAYGLWMPDFEKLARSLFVIDEEGTLIYYELVKEMATEPNFEEALKYL